MTALNKALELPLDQWDNSFLSSLITELRNRGGDSEAIEVKSATGGCPDLAPTLSAFANMPDGGLIILGLTELHFDAVGLTDVATLEAGIAAKARHALTPPVLYTFATRQHQGGDVLICRVKGLPLVDRPAFTDNKTYLRQSDGHYALSGQEIAHIELLKTQAHQRIHHDVDTVPGSSLRDLDEQLLVDYLAIARATSRRFATETDDTILKWTNVTTPSGELSTAGCYALGKYPQQFLPHLIVTAAVHLPRNDPGRTRNLRHFDGPLTDQLESVIEWVIGNIGTTMSYDDRGHGYDIPLSAVREIIANALVHRDLSATTQSRNIDIRLVGDKLTIVSPGGLFGVSVDQLGKPNGRNAVNQYLYGICKRLRLPDRSRVIEGEGGGIREAQNALAAAGLRAPRFIDSSVRFTSILWSHSMFTDDELAWLASLPETKQLDSTHRAILLALKSGEQLSNVDIRTRFGPLDSTEVRKIMQNLVDSGYVVAVGSKGNTRHQATEQLLEDAPSAAVDTPAAGVSKEQAILQFLTEPRSSAEIASATGLTTAQVRYRITKLREHGLVATTGTSARSMKYIRNK